MSRKRSSVVLIVLVACALMLAASAVAAQSPTTTGATLPYSARLTDPSGQPVDDGKYDFVFTLYASEKDDRALWSEMRSGIELTSGDLSVSLGQGVAIPKSLAERKELWLSVSVRGPNDPDFTLLSPRHNLAAPAAVSALTCPHSHFTDYWGGTNPSYGLEVDNSTGTGDGVRGYSGSTAYNYAGVYAINGGGTTPGGGGTGAYGSSFYGYGGYFRSDHYRGLYAKGNAGYYAAFIENPAGSTNVGLYVNGSMWVTGAKTGYVTDAALNDGPEPLETGDVVVITGAAEPLVGQIPVIRVRKASAAGGTAVAGVVDQGVAMQKGAQDEQAIPGVVGHEAHLADNTAIQPGEYLLIVTMGAYKGVKVDATLAPIHAGDLLVASGNTSYAGYAAASGSAGTGATSVDAMLNAVVGKALGEMKSGAGLIPVMVTLK